MLFLKIKDSQHKCTAGVYLLIRSSPLIEYSSTALLICLWLGAVTTVFSSLIGLFQQDIKKIIAYSTMSRLARECSIYLFTFRHQTICVKLKLMVFSNSQITKAHDYLNSHISYNFFNSPLISWLYNYIFLYVILSVRRKIIIISKLVGISEAIRLILIFVKLIIINLIKNSFILNKYILIWIYTSVYNIVYSMETQEQQPARNNYCNSFISVPTRFAPGHFRNIHTNINTDPIPATLASIAQKNKNKNLYFNQWLAGLIDGDGHFILTKKGYTSYEITMDARDKKTLNEIKHKYGGTIKPLADAYAVRYKLRHKKGLISLINDVNGLIRNPVKLLQMNKLCVKYDIELKYSEPLTFNNGWLSGFIDSDGSVYYNEASGQVFIGITQKNRYLLEPLIDIYGGRIDILSPKIEAFKYVIYRKAELFKLIKDYFNNYPLKTEKFKRVNLIKDFYALRIDNNRDGELSPQKFKEWIKFKDKWEKYQD